MKVYPENLKILQILIQTIPAGRDSAIARISPCECWNFSKTTLKLLCQ